METLKKIMKVIYEIIAIAIGFILGIIHLILATISAIVEFTDDLIILIVKKLGILPKKKHNITTPMLKELQAIPGTIFNIYDKMIIAKLGKQLLITKHISGEESLDSFFDCLINIRKNGITTLNSTFISFEELCMKADVDRGRTIHIIDTYYTNHEIISKSLNK